MIFRASQALTLDCGERLEGWQLAYQSWGQLNQARDNAVLVCHTMTTNHLAAESWWRLAVGPGLCIDTDRYFVVCCNVLGGCAGSTGPLSPRDGDGPLYGGDFPAVSVADMVRAQFFLLDHLQIPAWRAVVGGCMGGFQSLLWAQLFPDKVQRVVCIGAGPRTCAYSLAFYEVLRQAIFLDPHWQDGLYDSQDPPHRGLGLSSMLGMLFWMTPAVMEDRFGRRREGDRYAIEVFLERIAAGSKERAMDAHSFLRISRACSDFELNLGALSHIQARFLLVSYRTDTRYPPEHVAELEQALSAAGVSARHHVLDSRFGHGAFLLDVEGLAPLLRDFLE